MYLAKVGGGGLVRVGIRCGWWQVGCAVLGMKAIQEACVGDTLCDPAAVQPPLPGFARPQPQVFAGLSPVPDPDH